MNAPDEPLLAPPGAGLPGPELLAARLFFAAHRLFGNRSKFDARIARERHAILALVRACPPEDPARRVLIPRLRGMEDSSRYWSVWMTLDHLRITNGALAKIIPTLAQGVVPPKPASTAAVKPSPNVDAHVVEAFDRECDNVLQAAAGVPNLRTKARYAHPWFGLLDAAGWHALAGLHMRLHRRQIETILAEMRGEAPAAS
jgi:hypothetical protein